MKIIRALNPPVKGPGMAWFWSELQLVCLGQDEVHPPQTAFVDFVFSLKRKIRTAFTEFSNCRWCNRCQSAKACLGLNF